MYTRRIRIVALSALVLLTSCGGDNGSNRSGRLVIKVAWPIQSRLIPAAANSIAVKLFQFSQSGPDQIGLMILTPDTPSGTFSNVPVGHLQLTAAAYPSTDGSGVADAT